MQKLVTVSVLGLVLFGSVGLADPTRKPRRIELAITENGFVPDKVTVAKGEPLVFVFTRKTDKTCTKEVIIHLDDKQKLERKLPLNKAVEVALTFPKTGELGFGCSMDMHTGVIRVQ